MQIRVLFTPIKPLNTFHSYEKPGAYFWQVSAWPCPIINTKQATIIIITTMEALVEGRLMAHIIRWKKLYQKMSRKFYSSCENNEIFIFIVDCFIDFDMPIICEGLKTLFAVNQGYVRKSQ